MFNQIIGYKSVGEIFSYAPHTLLFYYHKYVIIIDIPLSIILYYTCCEFVPRQK